MYLEIKDVKKSYGKWHENARKEYKKNKKLKKVLDKRSRVW